MHDIDDETRKQVLGEFLMHEVEAIREYVEDVPVIKQGVGELRAKVEELSEDMKVVKLLSETSATASRAWTRC